MAKSREVKIALLGCGKLGQGLFKLWKEKRLKIKEQTGIDLALSHILVKHKNHKRDSAIPADIITDNINDILKDLDVQIVIDAMGGIEPTYGIIKQFLNRGCHIVSANRALLASKMREVFELARSRKVHLQFDAALGGGIPIVRMLKRDLIASNIKEMWGIVSGNANYLLTEMHRSKKSLKDVLKLPELQRLTEGHMLIDYEGADSAQKIALLAAMAFGVEINYLQVHAEGISHIKQVDIIFAEEFGYRIKLLAVLKDRNEGLELRVHPTLIPKDHPMNSVQYDYNAFYIHTDIVGEYMLYGKGAGIYPAANMIIRDLVEVATSIKTSSKYMYEFPLWHDKNVLPIEEINSGYYLRFTCLDIPGVMGRIATILGENNINIGSAHATRKAQIKSEKMGFVNIFIESAKEKDIFSAISQIKKFKIIKGETTVIRILGEQRNVSN
jgi:homoserine dehydrogenase